MPVRINFGVDPTISGPVAQESGRMAGQNAVNLQQTQWMANRSDMAMRMNQQRDMAILNQENALERMSAQERINKSASERAFGQRMEMLEREQMFRRGERSFDRDQQRSMQDDAQEHALRAMDRNAEVSKAIMQAKREADIEWYKTKNKIEQAKIQKRSAAYSNQMTNLEARYASGDLSAGAFMSGQKELNRLYGDVANRYIPADSELKDAVWQAPDGTDYPMVIANGEPDPASTRKQYFQEVREKEEIETQKLKQYHDSRSKLDQNKTNFILKATLEAFNSLKVEGNTEHNKAMLQWARDMAVENANQMFDPRYQQLMEDYNRVPPSQAQQPRQAAVEPEPSPHQMAAEEARLGQTQRIPVSSLPKETRAQIMKQHEALQRARQADPSKIRDPKKRDAAFDAMLKLENVASKYDFQN